MPPAAKHFDPILGIDVHIVQPPGPVPPVPVPHPHTGMVLDPFDYAPFVGGTVKVGGLQRAQAGTGTVMIPPHIPIGGVFVKPPGNEGEIFMGSSTVAADGDAFSYLALPVLTCQDVGIPAPGRPKGSPPKSLVLPTTVVLSIPLPVSVGGSPTVSLMALGMRAGLAALGAGLKKLKGLAKNSDKVKKFSAALHKKAGDVMKKLGIPPSVQRRVHDAICSVTGHPVDVASGRVFTRHLDFRLHGPIPLELERAWHSTSTHDGELGHGWHHVHDMALLLDEGIVLARLADGRYVPFPQLAVGEDVFLRQDGLTLRRDAHGYTLRTRQGLTHRFAHGPGMHAIEQRLQVIADDAGHRIVFMRDRKGALEAIIDSAGRRLRVHTDPKARITRIEAPHPDEARRMVPLVRYHYDEAGDLVRVDDVLGHATTYAYRDHLLVRETDPEGLSFRFEYEGEGAFARCVRTWGDGGIYERRFTYDDEAGTTTIVNGRGHRSVAHHDGAVVHAYQDPLGAVHRTVYDEDYFVLAEIDRADKEVRFQYDAWGNRTAVTDADGTTIRHDYDAQHRRIRTTDELGGVWTWTYDDKGRVRERTDPLGRTWRHSHAGLTLTVEDPDGGVTVIERNAMHDVISLRLPDGTLARWDYDGWGRPTRAISPTGAFEQRTFDLSGRPLRIHEPDGQCREYTYDRRGSIVRVKHAVRDVRLSYVGMGCIATRTEAGVTMRFQYDVEENVTAIIDPHGNARRFEYDANDSVVRETDPSGRTRTYVRDAVGQVMRVERPGERWSKYAYDASGRVVEVSHSDGTTLRYRYRPDGELIEAIAPDTKVSFQRDALGRIVRESRDGMWVGSEYGPKDLRTKITSSLGAEQSIERSVMGDASRVSEGAFLATFATDAFGLELERTLPGGIESRFTRDVLGREVEQTISRGGRTLRSRKLRWGPDDRLGEVHDSRCGVTRHGHDVTGGHAWTQHPDGEVTLRLPDAVGDRFATAERTDRRYGPSGELLWADGPNGRTTWRYDAEGMLAEKVTPSGETWRFVWNGAGMLAAVERPDGQTVRFAYDAIGRRITKTVGTLTHHTLWDGDVPLHEWTTEDGDRVGPTTSWIFEPETFAPLGKRVQDEVFGIVTDHLGTPQAMFDARGEPVWTAELDAWGRPRGLEGDAQACPFRWPGQREDAETGLYYNRFRYYDPDAGTYVSPDPIGWLGGLRPYAYADDVLSGCDPFGLKTANKAQGDAGEAAAKQWLDENGYDVLGSMENKSGHGVDVVYRDPDGNIGVAEVKTNGSALNRDQRKGADSLAQSRADRCLREKGHWKHGKKGSRKLAKKVMRQVAEKGAVDGLVFKYDVDADGVRLRDGYPKRWTPCK